jgi:hypothetical protein
MSTETVLRRALDGDVVILDPRFQGLPDTAHGGAVLALFDAVAALPGPRALSGVYRRRVPLATPLSLAIAADELGTTFALRDGGALLVDGRVVPGALTQDDGSLPPEGLALLAAAASPHDRLPVSRTCFACGTDNALGLQARLVIDDDLVGGMWTPLPALRANGDRLATVALTTLLDEAAFWLGAAACGEAGMTTDLRVTVHHAPRFGGPITFGGARATVAPHAGDARYWNTHVDAWDEHGARIASADITFVAVRGVARKLVAGLLAMNPPDVLARVFPSYVR